MPTGRGSHERVQSKHIGGERKKPTPYKRFMHPLGQDLLLSFSSGNSPQYNIADKAVIKKAKEDTKNIVSPQHKIVIPPLEEDFELHALLETLPSTLRDPILAYLKMNATQDASTQKQLVEIVMDSGRPPVLWFIDDTCVNAEEEVLPKHIEECLSCLLKDGKKFTSDNRVGISKTLHRISALRNRSSKIIGLTYRVGRPYPGVCELIKDLLHELVAPRQESDVATFVAATTGHNEHARKARARADVRSTNSKSLLLLGPPGSGKTTLLRDAARYLADELEKRVMIIDTSNEIAGDGDVPHKCIGMARRTQVRNRKKQFELMIEAVQNHSPQVVVIDEIGTGEEARSAKTIAQRGVSLIATAHGMHLGSLLKNPQLVNLVGGINVVTLGDKEAKIRGKGKKTITERRSVPTFQMVVELIGRNHWVVHKNVARVIDNMLNNQPHVTETRWVDRETDLMMACFEKVSCAYKKDIAEARKELMLSPHEKSAQEFPSKDS